MMFNFSLLFSIPESGWFAVSCSALKLEGVKEQESKGARESKGVNRAIASRLKRRGGHLMLLLTTIGAALMLH